jgi:hypothetical protein
MPKKKTPYFVIPGGYHKKKEKKQKENVYHVIMWEKYPQMGVPSAGSLSTNPANLLINPLQGPSKNHPTCLPIT